jgi:hypothetical protein
MIDTAYMLERVTIDCRLLDNREMFVLVRGVDRGGQHRQDEPTIFSSSVRAARTGARPSPSVRAGASVA